MKRIIFISIAFLSCINFVYTQEYQVFYYHNDEKVFLDQVKNTKIIHFNKNINPSQKENILYWIKISDYVVREITPIVYEVSGSVDKLEEISVVSTAMGKGEIIYKSDKLLYNGTDILWASNKLFVQIPLESDLDNILMRCSIPFKHFRQFGFNKQTYIITLGFTEKSAIEYANLLSETGSVVWAQPSFWKIVQKIIRTISHSGGYTMRGNMMVLLE